MLTPVTPIGSSLRLFYKGPIGVAGSGVTQSLDLTSLPLAVREDPSFQDNFLVLIEAGAGISDINPEVDFTFDADDLPDALVLTLSSDSEDNDVDLMAWYVHSVTR